MVISVGQYGQLISRTVKAIREPILYRMIQYSGNEIIQNQLAIDTSCHVCVIWVLFQFQEVKHDRNYSFWFNHEFCDMLKFSLIFLKARNESAYFIKIIVSYNFINSSTNNCILVSSSIATLLSTLSHFNSSNSLVR